MTTKQEVNNNRDEAFTVLANNIIPVNAFKILATALASNHIEWEQISHLPENHIEEEMSDYRRLFKAIKDTANDSSSFTKELPLKNVTTEQMNDYDEVMRDAHVHQRHYMIVPGIWDYLDKGNKGFRLLATELYYDEEDISELDLVVLYDEVAINAMTMIKLQHPT